jgi:lysozyme
MDISVKGLQLLYEWEGCVLHVYKDSAGYPTIGIGHLLTSEEKIGGKYADGITKEQALQILHDDLKRFVLVVNNHVRCSLTQNQFDALVILAFNIGDGGFASSTVLRRVNSGDLGVVPDAFRMWNKAGGKVNKGLIARRENEIKLWQGEL